MKAPGITYQEAHPEERGIERGGMQWFEDFGEFPKLMYRRAAKEVNPETGLPMNVFDGIPCETITASSADHQIELQADGYAVSPKAANDEAPRRGRPPKAAE